MAELISLFASFTLSAAKRRGGIESGYSSLEKTRSDEDTQPGPDQDCRFDHLTHATPLHAGLHFLTSVAHAWLSGTC